MCKYLNGHFTKRDIWMIIRTWTYIQYHQSLDKCSWKPQWDTHCTPTRKAKIKKMDYIKCWQDCGGLELAYTVDGNVKWCNCLGKYFGRFLKKVKNTPSIWASHSSLGYLPKRNESTHPTKAYTQIFITALLVITENNAKVSPVSP